MKNNPITPERRLARGIVSDWGDGAVGESLSDRIDDDKSDFVSDAVKRLKAEFPNGDELLMEEVAMDAYESAHDGFSDALKESLEADIPRVAKSKKRVRRSLRKKKKKRSSSVPRATKKVSKKKTSKIKPKRSMQRSRQPNPRRTIDSYLRKS